MGNWYKPGIKGNDEGGGGGSDTIEIVTWADGTDEQITAMLEAYYNDEIDIYEYWTVGDERTIHLSQIAGNWFPDASSSYGYGEAQPAQDIVMVLMNKGGKKLVAPINGHADCAFIVGQKNCLTNTGYLHGTYVEYISWTEFARCTWCNNNYRNAFPASLRNIFKLFCRYSTELDSPAPYFVLPEMVELTGSNLGIASSTENSYLSQFEYYKIFANRAKDKSYWLRTNHSTTRSNWFYASSSGSVDAYTTSAIYGTYGIAPFGVI